MGKGKRLKQKNRLKNKKQKTTGKNFAQDFSDRLTNNFQKELRNSEIWDQMVAEFGEEKATILLNDCKAEIKPG